MRGLLKGDNFTAQTIGKLEGFAGFPAAEGLSHRRFRGQGGDLSAIMPKFPSATGGEEEKVGASAIEIAGNEGTEGDGPVGEGLRFPGLQQAQLPRDFFMLAGVAAGQIGGLEAAGVPLGFGPEFTVRRAGCSGFVRSLELADLPVENLEERREDVGFIESGGGHSFQHDENRKGGSTPGRGQNSDARK